MLLSLDYHLKFLSGPKRQLKGSLVFQSGLTGITGPNEAGKSTILEMVRFALFGTAALRAPLSQYLMLSAKLTFQLKGKTYTIRRTKTSATLSLGATIITTGVGPVTSRITTLFGYDLAVFDIANFCQQGDVEALTKMKPTQRKQMVDRVIGLNAMAAAEKSSVAEKALLTAQLKGLSSGIGAMPVGPTEPLGYQTSSLIDAQLKDLQPILDQYREDKAWLASAPDAPEPCRVTDTVTSLRMYERYRLAAIQEAQQLQREIGDVSPIEFSEAELDEMEKWHEQEDFIKPSDWQESELLEMLRAADLAGEAEHIRSQIKCPTCGAERRVPNLAELNARLVAIGHVEKPPLSVVQITEERGRIDAWRGRHPLPRPPKVVSRDEVQRQRKARIPRPVIPADRSADLIERERYETIVAFWTEQREKEHATRSRRLQENEGIPDAVCGLEFDRQQSLDYEMRLALYTERSEEWKTKTAQATELEQQVEQWDRALKAIKELRTRVKTYLMPSLNRVSSMFLSHMTGGQRCTVIVSEDFSTILVDGQPVETLSGSAKAVTNLAIRLGLGRVLTNSVFSVFMGDEIDASMDDDRAEYTADCLKNLLDMTSQIILVSHKPLDVQHRITLC